MPNNRYSIRYKKIEPVTGFFTGQIVNYSARSAQRRVQAPNVEAAIDKLTRTLQARHAQEITVIPLRIWQYIPKPHARHTWENWTEVYRHIHPEPEKESE